MDQDEKAGAFVEEARKLMQDDDDRPKQQEEAGGGGIKMTKKLGAKGKQTSAQ